MSVKAINSNMPGATSRLPAQESDAEKLNHALTRVPCRFVEGFDGEDAENLITPFAVTRIINIQPNSGGVQIKEHLLIFESLFTPFNNRAPDQWGKSHHEEWVRYSKSSSYNNNVLYSDRHSISCESHYFFHRYMLNLLREKNREEDVAQLAESILSDRFSSPVTRIIFGYLNREPFPSREEQSSAERMKQVRIALFTTFSARPVSTKPQKKSLWEPRREAPEITVLKKVTEITAQFLDGTGIDETSPKQMALAADQGYELPLHLQVLHVSSREDGMTALQYAKTASGARELILAGAEPEPEETQ